MEVWLIGQKVAQPINSRQLSKNLTSSLPMYSAAMLGQKVAKAQPLPGTPIILDSGIFHFLLLLLNWTNLLLLVTDHIISCNNKVIQETLEDSLVPQ